MASMEDREDAVKALYRMVVYVRSEAARLRIDDAALLLSYAEDAIVMGNLVRGEDVVREGPLRMPIVQH